MTRPQGRGAAIEALASANGRPPEAADGVTLAAALHELVGILPGLRAALERTAHPAESPIAYRREPAAKLCGISVRLLERLASAGKFPRPDAYAGRCPLWTRATLERWVAGGGGRI